MIPSTSRRNGPRLWHLTALAIFLAVGAPTASAQSCKTADASSVRALDYVKELVTATDEDGVVRRNSVSLPAAAATQVVLVTDTRVCGKAVPAFNAALPSSWPGTRPTAAYVMQVGSGSTVRYVVTTPLANAGGEWDVYVVLDSKYAKLAKFNA